MSNATPQPCPIWCQQRRYADHGGDPLRHLWTGDDDTFGLEPGVCVERIDTESEIGPVRVVLDLAAAVESDESDDSAGGQLTADMATRLGISLLGAAVMIRDNGNRYPLTDRTV